MSIISKKATSEEVAFLCGIVDSYRTIVEEFCKVADVFDAITMMDATTNTNLGEVWLESHYPKGHSCGTS